jgi:hypothetical protein
VISITPGKIKFRENRSWGYDLKKGPEGLEATLVKKSGAKPYMRNTTAGQIGNVFIPVQIHKRMNEVQRLSVSAWVSFPAEVELSSAFKEKVLRAQKAIWRLAKLQISKFFRGKYYGKGKAGRAGSTEAKG